jgi:hypothetical protein
MDRSVAEDDPADFTKIVLQQGPGRNATSSKPSVPEQEADHQWRMGAAL